MRMTTTTNELLMKLTTNGQLAIAASKLITSGVFTGEQFKNAVAKTTPESFGGAIYYSASIGLADGSKDAADSVAEAITLYVL